MQTRKLLSFFLVVFLVSSLIPFISQKVEAQVTYLFDLSKWDSVFRVHNFTVANLKSTVENKSDGFQWNITCSGTVMKAWMTQNSNRSFTISTSKLAFYYQPPLDLELNVSDYDFVNATHAIKNGNVSVYRPENVVGSYAVYSTTKCGNEYMTGKLFHLYRPLLVDAVGKTSWGWLNLTANTLTIGWNKTWVALATFPLVIDPSFGKTSIGATERTQSTAFLSCKFIAPATGTITNVSCAVDNVSNEAMTVEMGVYNDDGGDPHDLLDSGTVVVPSVRQQQTFFNVTGLAASITNGLSYHLFSVGPGGGYQSGFYTDAGTGDQASLDLDKWTPAADPCGAVTHQDWEISIFATYTLFEGGQNLSFTNAESLYPSAYNLFGKELAFQSTSIFYPSSTGYFWKAIGFQSANSFMPLATSVMNKAIGYLASGTVNLRDSMTKGMSLTFQATDTINLWDSNTILKALGFQSSETLLPSAASTMNKALGFLTTNTLNVWDSMTKGMSLGFESSDILPFFSEGTSARASGINLFENSGLLNLFGNLDFNKELGFSFSELPHFFDNLSMGKAINVNLFEVFEAVNIQGLMTMLGGTFVAPVSNLPLMLGAFGVIMSIVALSFVLIRRRSDKEEE